MYVILAVPFLRCTDKSISVVDNFVAVLLRSDVSFLSVNNYFQFFMY